MHTQLAGIEPRDSNPYLRRKGLLIRKSFESGLSLSQSMSNADTTLTKKWRRSIKSYNKDLIMDVVQKALKGRNTLSSTRFKELMSFLNRHRHLSLSPNLVETCSWLHLPILRTASSVIEYPAHRITIRWVMFILKSRMYIRNRGLRNYVAWRKDIWTDYVRHLTNPSQPTRISRWIGRTEVGLPAICGLEAILPKSSRTYVEKDIPTVRFFLSLLRSYDLIPLPLKMDLASIVSGPTVQPEPTFFGDNNINLGKIFNLPKPNFPAETRTDDWFISRSSGPNCDLAPLGFKKDIDSLYYDQNLFNKVREFSRQVGAVNVYNHLQGYHYLMVRYYGKKDTYSRWLKEYFYPKYQEKIPLHSLNVAIPDKGGKTRIIAILDIYSQTSLKPFHDFFMNCLKRIPTDSTYDQQRGRLRVLNAARSGRTLYSFDLSNATDRLPLWAVYSAISPWFNEDLLDSALSVMSLRDFHWRERVPIPGSKKHKTVVHGPYRYTVGTPMGALASFPAGLALPHHAVVQYCAQREGLPLPFTDYAILGDDIVIWDNQVARLYRQTMTGVLGVTISESKSILGPMCAEFGKTIIARGEIITPLPWRLMQTASDGSGYALSILMDLFNRWNEAVIPLKTLRSVAFDGWQVALCPLFSRIRVVRNCPKGLNWLNTYRRLFDLSHEEKLKLLFTISFGDLSGILSNWKEFRHRFIEARHYCIDDMDPPGKNNYVGSGFWKSGRAMSVIRHEYLASSISPKEQLIREIKPWVIETVDLETECLKKLGEFLPEDGELSFLEYRDWLISFRARIMDTHNFEWFSMTPAERRRHIEMKDQLPDKVLKNVADYYKRQGIEPPPDSVCVSYLVKDTREQLFALRKAASHPMVCESSPLDR